MPTSIRCAAPQRGPGRRGHRARPLRDSDAVRNKAVWMAYGVLDEAEVKDEQLVAALGDLIFDLRNG